MQIIVAEHAGFCFGVKNAVRLLEDLIKKGGKTYTLGPIVHNQQVVKKMENLGVKAVDVDDISEGNLVIRTHGVPPDVIERARARGLNVIDATCPFVKKVQKLAQDLSSKGYTVVIIGDPNHPEVKGIKGWCPGEAVVIENEEDARAFFTDKRVGVVVQTTQTEENVKRIMDILKEKLDLAVFHNTRCNATQQRQEAAKKVAELVNVMLVVGGKNSSNTKKLVQVCQNVGARVYHIETAEEIKQEWFQEVEKVGITAGASTPDWIIKEVITKMEEISKEMENQQREVAYDDEISELAEGKIVEGTVMKVSDKEVLVNVGYKSEGIIPLNELSNLPFSSPSEIVKNGDRIKVLILKLEDKEGNLILSKKRADTVEAWSYLEEAFEKKQTVEGRVIESIKGGLLVNVRGLRGFIPASHADLKYVADLSGYVGKDLKLKIIELDRDKKRVVLSHKLFLQEEKEKLKEEIWEKVKEGQVIRGTVKKLTDFGAFVDIGGFDGLIHISDLSWQRINHPSEVLSENQEVEVKVLKVDKERGRISLGLKQLSPDPWDNIEQKYAIGQVIQGRVVKLTNFGAFVELEPGVEGLVHVSQISKKRVATPKDALKEGETVKAKILDIKPEEKRISLSIKQALDDEQPPRKEKKNEEKTSVPREELNVTIGDVVGDIFKKDENNND
ncbi:bifunctional 4-hydroxy-3-methylbut-2-enyl diphosphate reductase/30S ribosomal protein S1 [Thermosediminibacter litoriperuensis]|uniref:4-hydroxy-3-methylbut-2-enyl diphosphate reductase n=1 Tax=Thermosediminibacter litoriperuensis TaxID=291989 RepID=A0A5S5AYT1_9FIRM|nr:bifunctional 4-hydroxy-3-methylbut-2-enyl diphosphate reductase/30S ribosomal protein S1 [Thermosediminibacter litoriperuensis]TYP59867.1 4-hydroxy-3-methylbut-2-enyl diphosphate reductase [Thermosediminibacter litoriperuensis]